MLLDPSHLPAGLQEDHPPRGHALYDHHKRSGSRVLPIPDLRFEQSYLRSIHRFIHDSGDLGGNGTGGPRHESGEKGKSAQTAGRAPVAAPGVYGIPLRFDWGWILYMTMRDQIFAPLAQGAVWALFSQYFRPCLRGIGGWVRIHFWRSWRSIFPPLEPRIHGGVGWMRDQFRGFTMSSLGNNVALAK